MFAKIINRRQKSPVNIFFGTVHKQTLVRFWSAFIYNHTWWLSGEFAHLCQPLWLYQNQMFDGERKMSHINFNRECGLLRVSPCYSGDVRHHMLITLQTILDPDQGLQKVGPDLDPIRLTLVGL